MSIYLKNPKIRGKNLLIIPIIAGLTIWISALIFGLETKSMEDGFFLNFLPVLPQNRELATIQENSLLPVANPLHPIKKVKMVITAYSSTPWETDNDPYITAAGTLVRDGIVANNFLPFGTQIRIPEIYGDKVFMVEDRMHWSKSNYHIDIWFPEYWQAKNFGAKRAYVEILEG